MRALTIPLLISVCGKGWANPGSRIARMSISRRARATIHFIIKNLWPDDRTVAPAEGPFAGVVVDRIFIRQFLVDIYAKTGRFIDIHITFLQFGATREHLPDRVVEEDRLLYAEVPDGEVDVTLGSVTDGRYVAGAMPTGPDIEKFPEVRHLYRGR